MGNHFPPTEPVLDCFDGVEAGVEGGGAQKLHQDLRDILKGKRKAQIGPKFHRVCFKPRIFWLGLAFLRNFPIKVFDFFWGKYIQSEYYVYLRYLFGLYPIYLFTRIFETNVLGAINGFIYQLSVGRTNLHSKKETNKKKHGWIPPSQYPLLVETMFYVLDSKRSWESIWTCSHHFVLRLPSGGQSCRLCGAVVRRNTKRLQVPCRKLAVANRHGQVLGEKKKMNLERASLMGGGVAGETRACLRTVSSQHLLRSTTSKNALRRWVNHVNWRVQSIYFDTPPKFNIAPENWWLEDEFPFGIADF